MVWQETLLVNQPALRNIKTVDDTLEKIEALDQIQKRKDIQAEEAEARQKLPEENDENALDLKVRLKIRLALSEEEGVYRRMT